MSIHKLLITIALISVQTMYTMNYKRQLWQALKHGTIEKAQEALDDGASVSIRTHFGATPLHMAAYNGFATIARLLIENGASIDAIDKDGNAPLYNAVSQQHLDVVIVLLINGAQVQPIINNRVCNREILHSAVENNDSDIIELLLQKTIYINIQDFKGQTALHKAVQKSINPKVISLLLSNGINPCIVDASGKTALCYLKKRFHSMLYNKNKIMLKPVIDILRTAMLKRRHSY